MALVILLLKPMLLFSVLSGEELKADKLLFEIGRSRDQNRIIYEAGILNDGKLDPNKPITIYWKKGNYTEPLTYIQQKFAYGLVIDEVREESARFHFVSYPKRELWLHKSSLLNKYQVLIEHQGSLIILNEIFIQIDGGTFWLPKISNVCLKLVHPVSRKSFVENINPKKK